MKKLVFLIAVIFTGTLSVNAQVAPKGFFKIDLGFDRVSSYAGPCVSGTGTCTGSSTTTEFNAGISRISETVVSYAFTGAFFEANRRHLANGLTIGSQYSLPGSISAKIGFTGEFVVQPGTYAVTERDGLYYVSIPRAK